MCTVCCVLCTVRFMDCLAVIEGEWKVDRGGLEGSGEPGRGKGGTEGEIPLEGISQVC